MAGWHTTGESMARDRTDLWLSLLPRLTARFRGWAVWKNLQSAFAGTGDVDSFAPPSQWPAIQALFLEWAQERGLHPTVICRHIPQGPHFITFEADSPYLVQLDVKERGTFRGSTLVDAWSLLPLTAVDELGVRRVRAGAEGVIKLCMNGTQRGGHPDHEALRVKRVAELLGSDPEGVALAAALLGPARGALLRGADAVVAGGWDRRAMATVEAWSAARGLAEPGVAWSRWRFLRVEAKRCPVVSLIREHDRRVPDDREAWFAKVAADHELVGRA